MAVILVIHNLDQSIGTLVDPFKGEKEKGFVRFAQGTSATRGFTLTVNGRAVDGASKSDIENGRVTIDFTGRHSPIAIITEDGQWHDRFEEMGDDECMDESVRYLTTFDDEDMRMTLVELIYS